jgi:uncharacterized protein YjbJ (UPF0337 family)
VRTHAGRNGLPAASDGSIFGERGYSMRVWLDPDKLAQQGGLASEPPVILTKPWGKLADDDWKVVEGRRDQLIGKVQERYGITREEAERQLADFERTHEKV